MKKINFFLLFVVFLSCRNDFKKESTSDNRVYVDSLYTLDKTFKIGDVRRYGVEPYSEIGEHPKLLKDKLEVLMDISELGIKIFFPKGVYNRTINIDNREKLQIISDSAVFTGAINIKNSSNVKLEGVIQTLSRFYTQNSTNLVVESIVTKTDTLIKNNIPRSTGVSIHGGSKNIKIGNILIKDSGSGSTLYKHIKGGLIVHGHNNEPSDIKIDSVTIESSDRHGIYLTGEDIDIKYLNIKKFGIGSSKHMVPMEGGIDGEQIDFAGLWIKNCHNSFIDLAIIDTKASQGKYSINFDIGEEFRPTKIKKLVIYERDLEEPIERRIFSRTGVIVDKIISK